MYEISILEYVKLLGFVPKKKTTTIRPVPKFSYLGILRIELKKTIAIFEISTL